MASLAWGGFQNGRIPYDRMVDITGNGDWAHPAAAASWRWMVADCYAATGVRLGIAEAYRTYASQAWYAGPNSPLPKNVARARPGTSNHGWGRALDITGYDAAWGWLQANAARYGWDWTTGRNSNERWHWEYIGSLTNVAGLNIQELKENEQKEIIMPAPGTLMQHRNGKDTGWYYVRELGLEQIKHPTEIGALGLQQTPPDLPSGEWMKYAPVIDGAVGMSLLVSQINKNRADHGLPPLS